MTPKRAKSIIERTSLMNNSTKLMTESEIRLINEAWMNHDMTFDDVLKHVADGSLNLISRYAEIIAEEFGMKATKNDDGSFIFRKVA